MARDVHTLFLLPILCRHWQHSPPITRGKSAIKNLTQKIDLYAS